MAKVTESDIAGFQKHWERFERVQKQVKLDGSFDSFLQFADAMAADMDANPDNEAVRPLVTDFRRLVKKIRAAPVGPNRDKLLFKAGSLYGALELRTGLGGSREKRISAERDGSDKARENRAAGMKKRNEAILSEAKFLLVGPGSKSNKAVAAQLFPKYEDHKYPIKTEATMYKMVAKAAKALKAKRPASP